MPPPMPVATLATRPDLLPIVAGWLWHAFWRDDGYTLDQTIATYAECVAPAGAPQTFIVLDGATPVATATLARHDLDERPNLSPWLAGVYVVPHARNRGHARTAIAAVEAAIRAAGIPAAWLYTSTAEGLYTRLGWQAVEQVPRLGRGPVTLMRKGFGPATQA